MAQADMHAYTHSAPSCNSPAIMQNAHYFLHLFQQSCKDFLGEASGFSRKAHRKCVAVAQEQHDGYAFRVFLAHAGQVAQRRPHAA